MRDVTPEERQAWQSGQSKYLELVFEDGRVLANQDIVGESMSFEQSVCDTDDGLEFGQVASSCFKAQVFADTERYKGSWFTATIYVDTYSYRIGKFIVESDVASDDRNYRNLVAYDELHYVLQNDYSSWHNSLAFPMTIKQYRDAFFRHIKIEQQPTTLVNDTVSINKNFVADNFSGADVLYYICQLNATMGFMNSAGKFQYIVFAQPSDALFPAETLYPADTLYPKDWVQQKLGGTSGANETYIQGTFRYEDYIVNNITQVQIRQTESDVGAVVGSAGNTYVIQNNPLLYNKSTSELSTIGTRFLSNISYISYTPSEVTCPAAPWMELGDAIGIIGPKQRVDMYILHRTMTGITALMDTYKAMGTEFYSEKANSVNKSIKVLNQRTNELVRTVDETRSTITNVQTDLNGEITTRQSEIQQLADQITLKVSKGNVSSQISLESGNVTIRGNRLLIDSTNFKVNRNGTIEATNGKFTGTITGSAISGGTLRIGDWALSGNKGKTNGTGINITSAGVVQMGGISFYVNGSDWSRMSVQSGSYGGRLVLWRGAYIGGGEGQTRGTVIEGLRVTSANNNVPSNERNFKCEATAEFAHKVTINRSQTGDTAYDVICKGQVNIQNATTNGYALYVEGQARFDRNVQFYNSVLNASGGQEFYSDIRLKKNIEDIKDSETFVYSLKPKQFQYKINDDKTHHGFIAQEVQKIAPWLVSKYKYDNGEEYLSIRYTDIIADLVNVVQTQHEEIEELKDKLKRLEERLDAAGI